MKLMKKLTLLSLLIAMVPAQAGWLPNWLSNALPSFNTKNTLYFGAGLMASGIILGSYLWYKKSYNKLNVKPNRQTRLNISNQDQQQSLNAQQENLNIDEPQEITTSPNFDQSYEEFEEEYNNKKFIESFALWHEICTGLPPYQSPSVEQYNQKDANFVDPANKRQGVSAVDLKTALDTYLTTIQEDPYLTNDQYWVNKTRTEELFESLQSKKSKPVFDPYVQKLVLNNNAIVAFHGDIHGDVHSLVTFLNKLHSDGYLENFKITDPNFFMVFLGDYTDRGWYGAEVIYTILQLKCANPSQVFLVRGNHEDRQQNQPQSIHPSNVNNFYGQLAAKYPQKKADKLFAKIQKMYETLPLALYLGSGDENHKDFILCCHGGIELGFDPQELLNHGESIAFTKLGTLDRGAQLEKLNNPEIMQLFANINTKVAAFKDLKQNIVGSNGGLQYNPHLLKFKPKNLITIKKDPLNKRKKIGLFTGFQWNDYEVDSDHELNIFKPWFVKNGKGRGWVIGKTFNKAVLAVQSTDQNIVHGVFRAHQHTGDPENAMMRSILKTDEADDISNKGVSKLWTEQKEQKHDDNPKLLWDNIVCTFNVCPHTPYQSAGFDFDTYGLLHLAQDYNAWRLEVVQI